MRDKDLYAQILGIKSPWQVSGVELALSEGEVTVHVEQEEGVQHCCPTCGEVSPGYDSRKRKWRHLDTCQYKTILVADVPRVKCKEHGVVTVSVPWAEPGSGFTAMFEALVIDWLQACLRPRDRFWDIPVPKIDSAFDNPLVPQPSWSPSTTQQLRKLVAAPYLAPNDWTPRSEAYFVFPLAQGTPGK